MNLVHQWICSSRWWARGVARSYLPWALDGVALGDDVLEVGPGYGATTRELVAQAGALTALELDSALACRLERQLGQRVRVVQGDGTCMPFAPATFSAVTCFSMLHHIPAATLQDGLFAEAFRVLRPRGVFAGSDSLPGLVMSLIHIRDTMVLVDPESLPRRLAAAGFIDIAVDRDGRRALRFRARKPAPPERA